MKKVLEQGVQDQNFFAMNEHRGKRDMRKRKVLALALAACLLAGILPGAAWAAGESAELITNQCDVTASSGQDSASKAVDGNTESPSQWASADMKTGGAAADPSADQTPQWLTVDLGADKTYPIAIDSIKLWYNAKVWPMVYRIETAASNDASAQWTTLVSVSRSPFDGAVKNGVGQDIADETGNTDPATAANTDTITKTSSPALAQDAAVQRYVRFYVEKVNTAAPGNNVCLREIQIFGINENLRTPVDVAAELAKVTSVAVNAGGGQQRRHRRQKHRRAGGHPPDPGLGQREPRRLPAEKPHRHRP